MAKYAQAPFDIVFDSQGGQTELDSYKVLSPTGKML